MTERSFDPARALGERLASMDRQELCRLAISLCRLIEEENGARAYRGGLFPENISLDEAGEPAVGPGLLSGWGERELRFIPPELYWDGEAGPEGDVYALGLLLYYGLSGGRLPLEGESPNAQLSRISGQAFSAPPDAGLRLGEIVAKAASFKASDRFPTVKELRVMLESCEENKYLSEDAGAELFRKSEDELSEVERMMLSIIGGEPEKPAAPEEAPPELRAEGASETEPEAAEGEKAAETAELSEEEAARLILGGGEKAQEDPALAAAERQALVEEVFGKPEEPQPAEEPAPQVLLPEERSNPMEGDTARFPDDKEDVRVYEPSREKKDHVPIPILTEEKNPELAPIVPKRTTPSFSYNKDPVRDRKIAQDVKKRRSRPLGVVLILCGLLIIAALAANHFLQNYQWADEGRGRQIDMPDVGENAISTENGFVTAEELQRQGEEAAQRQSYYQVFKGDFSWTDAKNACNEQGGILAVINTQDEFTMVTQLAQNSGVQGVWVGCHRENSFLQWETEEPVGVMTWAENEPSYTDYRDGAAEDYVMLWNNGGVWAYIDCRNDPVFADPNIYKGVIGYVCEFES